MKIEVSLTSMLDMLSADSIAPLSTSCFQNNVGCGSSISNRTMKAVSFDFDKKDAICKYRKSLQTSLAGESVLKCTTAEIDDIEKDETIPITKTCISLCEKLREKLLFEIQFEDDDVLSASPIKIAKCLLKTKSTVRNHNILLYSFLLSEH